LKAWPVASHPLQRRRAEAIFLAAIKQCAYALEKFAIARRARQHA
jgi:hypothetical protein